MVHPMAALERLIPKPVGLSSEVKQSAARAERSWEAVTGLFGGLAATGTAAVAVGAAIPPIAPFLALAAASTFYFKLRAKWAKEDPARSDFRRTTKYRVPRIDVMPVMPPGEILPGMELIHSLFAAGASLEATVTCVERAMGASVAAAEKPRDKEIRTALVDRVHETQEHARRTETLAGTVRTAAERLNGTLKLTKFRELWTSEGASSVTPGRTLLETLDKHDVGRLISTGIDERYLDTPVRRQPNLENSESEVDLLLEAGAATEELAVTLRSWSMELMLEVERF